MTAVTPQSPFDICIIVYNPKSTRAAQVRRRIAGLRQFFPAEAVQLIEIVPHQPEANLASLRHAAKSMSGRALLAIAGGDGTVNFVVDTLLHDPHFTPGQQQITILPLWGGNGNDLAHMLNGTPILSMKRLLGTARRVAVYPMLCEITSNEAMRTHTAICYASFGASAYAAAALEAKRGKLSKARFMHELRVVSDAMRRAKRFIVMDEHAERKIYDRLFIKGSRFAKFGAVPQRLTDKSFLHITVEEKRLSSQAFHFSELMRRHLANYIVTDKEAVSFVIHEPTWAQIDGEIMQLKAGTHIRIHLSRRPFYALSTLLSR